MLDSPYRPPSSLLTNYDSKDIYRRKNRVVCPPSAAWPNRCYKCNAQTELFNHKKIYYFNSLWYLTILIAWILTAILYYALRRKVEVNLPMCHRHQRRTRFFQWAAGLSFLSIPLFAFPGAAFNLDALILLSLLGLLAGMVFLIACNTVRVAKYSEFEVEFMGAGKAFLNSLPDKI